MKLQFGERDFDGELVFDRYLGDGVELDILQALLATLAPRWCSNLKLWREDADQRPIEIGSSGALKAAVMEAIAERGSTYRALVERYGQPPLERVVGTVELRGAGPELVAVISIDQLVLSPRGRAKDMANSVALQIRRPTVEGSAGLDWLRVAFEVLCAELSPAWASAGQSAEYWAKVMSDPPRVEAVGRDFARFLPGVFWLNFFGRRLRDKLGDDRLRLTPAERVTVVDEGVLVEVAPDPLAWDTPGYESAELKVRDHLGADLFFSKSDPDRSTAMPF